MPPAPSPRRGRTRQATRHLHEPSGTPRCRCRARQTIIRIPSLQSVAIPRHRPSPPNELFGWTDLAGRGGALGTSVRQQWPGRRILILRADTLKLCDDLGAERQQGCRILETQEGRDRSRQRTIRHAEPGKRSETPDQDMRVNSQSTAAVVPPAQGRVARTDGRPA